MNTDKLQIALNDLLQQREKLTAELDTAITALRVIIARNSADAEQKESQHRRRDIPSYITMAEGYLQTVGKPAHIAQIVEYICTIRKNPEIKRASVEAGLLRHISEKGTSARFIKLGKGMYGLPTHAQKPLDLNSSAAAAVH